MSEIKESSDSGEVKINAPEIQTPSNKLSPEGMSAMQGLQEGRPEVTDTSELAPAVTPGTEDPVLSAKGGPSQVMTPKGISAMQGKKI
jgi:hypothetical protein